MSLVIRALLAASLLCTMGGPVAAQSWPSRPVKVIVAAGPGLAMDIAARLMSQSLSQALGQQMFVENLPGNSGMIGAQAAARAAPDGHTIYFAVASTLASNQFLFKTVPYDPEKDFVPVAIYSDSGPAALSVNPDLPVKTLPELIALAKAQPGKLSYGVDPSSGYSLIVGQLFLKRAGVDIVEIPYKSTPQMLQEAATGTTQMTISSLGAVRAYANQGRLRTIAITSNKRFPGLDDLPTVTETLGNFHVDGWMAVVAPAGTPVEIVQRLNSEIYRHLTDEEIKKRLLSLAVAPSRPRTPAETAEFIRTERSHWRAIAEELKIQPQ
jgi:tripartite-type tricarboxylate transporter receptor subunit TctC